MMCIIWILPGWLLCPTSYLCTPIYTTWIQQTACNDIHYVHITAIHICYIGWTTESCEDHLIFVWKCWSLSTISLQTDNKIKDTSEVFRKCNQTLTGCTCSWIKTKTELYLVRERHYCQGKLCNCLWISVLLHFSLCNQQLYHIVTVTMLPADWHQSAQTDKDLNEWSSPKPYVGISRGPFDPELVFSPL